VKTRRRLTATAFGPLNAVSRFHLWVVLRDNRGGLSWQSCVIEVE
jgi:hypothetical protein